MLKDSLIGVITNFIVYWLTHRSFREGIYQFVDNTLDALGTDIISERFPIPEDAERTIE